MKTLSTFAIARATLVSLLRNRLTTFLISLMVMFTLLCVVISTVDAGVRFRLFENLMLSGQALLLYGFAWLYSFEILRREQSDLLFMLPLSTGIARSDYLIGRFLGLSLVIMILGGCFVLLDAILMFWLEGAFIWQPLMQIVITTFGAILAAAIVFCFGVITSAFSAVIYSLLFWLIGHGLDELYLFAEQQMSVVAQSITKLFYYLLPNFSLTDLSTTALNRLPSTSWDWIFPMIYSLGYSAILLLIASSLYRRKALVGND